MTTAATATSPPWMTWKLSSHWDLTPRRRTSWQCSKGFKGTVERDKDFAEDNLEGEAADVREMEDKGKELDHVRIDQDAASIAARKST